MITRLLGIISMITFAARIAQRIRPRLTGAGAQDLQRAVDGADTVSYQERVVSALAHLCLVVNLISVVGGFMLVLLLAAFGPPSTGYVGRQVRQALLWQAQVWIASLMLLISVHLVWGGWTQVVLIPLELLLWLSAIGYALCAAILCLRGRRFRYWRPC